MTVEETWTRADADAFDVPVAARELVSGLLDEPWGQVSPSVYETGRLVTLAPWLDGQAYRLEWLVAMQRADGRWGARHNGYALVPTLSATEAIVGALRSWGRRDAAGVDRAKLIKAADQGLHVLFRWLHGNDGELQLPDMPAIELIVPSLIALINEHVESLRNELVPGLDSWRGTEAFRPPAGLDDGVLATIRSLLGPGAVVPEKLLHALEVAGDAAVGIPTVRPESTGTVGASPAATAAWLGHRAPPDTGDPARRYLKTVVERNDGLAPCGIPITIFERAWVLSWLLRAGIDVAVPPVLAVSLASAIGPTGTSAAAGLPADADTTAGALYALSLLGDPRAPDPLWAYEMDTHFCTWQGEDGLSATTNAHVLEAFGHYLETGSASTGLRSRYASTCDKVVSLLCAMQETDGSWFDRWHSSPYYATACAALALDRFGGAGAAPAVRKAVRWVLDTQRADGSWGHWSATAEETAYAIQILLLTRRDGQGEARETAVALGRDHLLRSVVRPSGERAHDPPLWHDKDLYRPAAIVRAAVLAALHLTQRIPSVSMR
ncbi:MAG: prenyltransferase/squalene oxidase repeat-containing protein [Actinomadura sp.]